MIMGMMIMMTIKTYSELSKFKTFRERFDYLKLSGVVGEETFGHDRYLNQLLYKDYIWRSVRDEVIARDGACDLGVDGHDYDEGEIIIVHHMNPITIDDVVARKPYVFDPEYLVSCRHRTHNAIHYSDSSILAIEPIERTKNDTCPWKRD